MLKRYIFFPTIWVFIIFFWAMPALAEMIVDTAWVRRYNGPGNSDDGVTAMDVDKNCNVYVTGCSYDVSGTKVDYATIKYLENGDTAWVRRYDSGWSGDNVPYALVTDDSGNVYVTGWSGGFCTIKYYSNGDTAWVRIYHKPDETGNTAQALAVDVYGNVYVTGWGNYENMTNIDFVTVKYFPNGDTNWVRIYSGPGSQEDMARALAVDNLGNIYVSGFMTDSAGSQRCATIKYYPNGDTAWVRTYSNGGVYAITLDDSNNVYVTGQGGIDYATIKYYPDGDTAWVRIYKGMGNYNRAYDIAIDSYSNVYVTGMSYSNETSYDYATIKYYSNGDTSWVRRYNGPGDDWDEAHSITLDGSGNVYVTGFSYGYGTERDYATVKYYPNGDTAWVRRYNGPGNGYDAASDITTDHSGNVYVTGLSDQISQHPYNRDYATIKYFQALRGDANRDWVIDIGDVVYLINYLFKNDPAPMPVLQVGDCNCDGVVDVGDVIYVINYLFKGGPAPAC